MIEVVCAIIIKKEKILAVQRGLETDHPCKWEFPGGKVMPDEKADEAIIREILEELEIAVSPVLSLAHINYNYGFKSIRLIPFICITDNYKLVLTEHIKYGFFTLREMQKLDLAEADMELIKNKKNQKILSEYIRGNMNYSC